MVVTAIGISPTLAWLWKRQWIDFRRCASADDSKRRSALPVPEALDRARLPLRPALAHHLLCSMAGLGLVGTNIVADAQQSDLDTLGMLTGISTVCLLWLAWRFAGRRVSQPRFNTWLTVVWSALTLLCVAQFIRYFEIKGFSLRIIPAAIFLAVAPFVAVRWRPALRFGFRSRRSTPRAQATAHPIAQLVDTSAIFSSTAGLDVAFGLVQIGFQPNSSLTQ